MYSYESTALAAGLAYSLDFFFTEAHVGKVQME
jgi:hypothetical protein